METGADPDYLAYLQLLYTHKNKRRALTNGQRNPTPTLENKPKRKRIGHGASTKEVIIKQSGGQRTQLEPASARSRKRRNENKDKGLKGKQLVSQTYDLDYFNYLSHMKVLEDGIAVEVGGQVVVRYEKEVENSGFEKAREHPAVLVQYSMEKGGVLEAESGLKSKKKGALLTGGEENGDIDQIGTSFGESLIQCENESVVAQDVGCAQVPENTDNVRQKENQNKEMEIGCGQQASHEPEKVNPHLQGCMLLVKKQCPVETTIYPGFTGNENAIVATGEPCTATNLEKDPYQDEKRATNHCSPRGFFDFDWIEDKGEGEVPKAKRKLRHRGNRRDCIELEGFAAFLDLPDSDEEPQIDEIPGKILRRPPSDYKDKLIEVLRRPFDKSEYIDLMIEATIRKRKVIYKQLRSVDKAVETDEKSRSLFDYYPEFKSQVERAKCVRQLTLLRGFFFWLKNCCFKGSFKPWLKGFKDCMHITISDP